MRRRRCSDSYSTIWVADVRARFAAAVCLVGLTLVTATRAQDSLDDIEAPASDGASNAARSDASVGTAAPPRPTEGGGKATSEVNGYFQNRLSFARIDTLGPASTRDVPSIAELAEANIQLRVNLGNRARFAYSDLSLIYQGGWLFYDRDAAGHRVRVPHHDVPSLRPVIVPSELYLSVSPEPWLNLLAGKKRITWGSGFAFNPTDLVNPPKDPTDPTFQRAGSWVARIEAPFETFTLTALFAPQAFYTQSGIPSGFVESPGVPAEPRDGSAHYLMAARMYALLWGADVNLVYYFSNRYQDQFEAKSRFGASFSRYFFTDYELHAEALFQLGSPRLFPVHSCATLERSCDLASSFTPSRLDSKKLYPRVVVGTRRQFDDESLVSLEYYFQRDGYSDAKFDDTITLLAHAKQEGASAPDATSRSGGALPQRFSFNPLRKHYLIASYTKPRIFDDWTVNAVLIAGIRDVSGIFSLSVAWNPKEWLTLTGYGYMPVRGLGVGEASVGSQRFSEHSLVPYNYRALLEARVFY